MARESAGWSHFREIHITKKEKQTASITCNLQIYCNVTLSTQNFRLNLIADGGGVLAETPHQFRV